MEKNDLKDGKKFFQKGLGLKREVQDILKKEYFSDVVTYFRLNDNVLRHGNITIQLAKELGFCYGVDRAVDYAYQTRKKFPEKRIFLTGEIIHNPHVNKRLIDMGVKFLSGQYSNGETHASLNADDVVVLPAFGVSIQEFDILKNSGAILVDTTCGSVLNVWKRVIYYARNGYTSIIHGKRNHEETIATSSQALKYPGGKYLIVRNMDEIERVCDYIVSSGSAANFLSYFGKSVSPGFEPDRDLQKIGVANQTTMLSGESLAIAERLQVALREKYGNEKLEFHFQTFDTICSATQDRQDAVMEIVHNHKLDLMLVVGGFNSSNTTHLADITAKYTKTYHIDDPACILENGRIRHKKNGASDIVVSDEWLPKDGFLMGLTAGASTPNNKIGEAVEKVLLQSGIEPRAIFEN